MTNDDILKVARECGANFEPMIQGMPLTFILDKDIITFARRIAAMQREIDAGICLKASHRRDDMGAILSTAIREQSE